MWSLQMVGGGYSMISNEEGDKKDCGADEGREGGG